MWPFSEINWTNINYFFTGRLSTFCKKALIYHKSRLGKNCTTLSSLSKKCKNFKDFKSPQKPSWKKLYNFELALLWVITQRRASSNLYNFFQGGFCGDLKSFCRTLKASKWKNHLHLYNLFQKTGYRNGTLTWNESISNISILNILWKHQEASGFV